MVCVPMLFPLHHVLVAGAHETGEIGRRSEGRVTGSEIGAATAVADGKSRADFARTEVRTPAHIATHVIVVQSGQQESSVRSYERSPNRKRQI